MSELTQTQNRRRKHLETEIRSSANTMGANLKAIHDEKLYRSTHKTWEAYCQGVWGMSRSYAYRIIKHGQLLSLLDESKMSPIGDISESATRIVSDMPEDQAVEVLSEAIGTANGDVTAEHVAETRRKSEPVGSLLEGDDELESDATDDETTTLDDAIKSHNKVIRGLSDDLGRVYKTAETYGETNGWLDANRLQELNGRVQSAKNTLNAVKAVDACPYCDGVGCKRCRQTGYVNKTTKDAAPEK